MGTMKTPQQVAASALKGIRHECSQLRALAVKLRREAKSLHSQTKVS